MKTIPIKKTDIDIRQFNQPPIQMAFSIVYNDIIPIRFVLSIDLNS